MNHLVGQFGWYLAGNLSWALWRAHVECPADVLQHSCEVHRNQKLVGQVS